MQKNKWKTVLTAYCMVIFSSKGFAQPVNDDLIADRDREHRRDSNLQMLFDKNRGDLQTTFHYPCKHYLLYEADFNRYWSYPEDLSTNPPCDPEIENEFPK